MNMFRSLLNKFREYSDGYVTISPIAQAVKQDLENWPDKTQPQPEIRAALFDRHLVGLSDERAAAALYSGLMLFDPSELGKWAEGVPWLYCGMLEEATDKLYNCEREWDLTEDDFLNTLRVAEMLAPQVYLGMRKATWFLTPLVDRAVATRNPALIEAVAKVVDAGFRSQAENANLMHQDLKKWFEVTGLPTEAIPAFGERDSRVARLLAERRKIIENAPSPLDDAIESAFESRIRYYQLAKGHHPHVDAVIDGTPAERGEALRYLLDVVVEDGVRKDFRYLGRINGHWAHDCGEHGGPTVFLDVLAWFFARFAHELDNRDAVHAKLVLILRESHGGYIKPNRMVLRELLKTVAEKPDGETVQGLRELVKRPAYSSWRQPLEDALLKTGPDDQSSSELSLELPDWKMGDYRTSDNFVAHFSNLFEPRLYRDPHDDQMKVVVGVFRELYRAQEAGTGEDDLQHLLKAELKRTQLPSSFIRGDSLSWATAVTMLSSCARLYVLREALRPLANQHPEILREMASLVPTLTKGAAPSKKWGSKARGIFERLSPSVWLEVVQAVFQNQAPMRSEHGTSGDVHIRTLIFLTSDLDPEHVGPLLVQYVIKQCYITEPGIGMRNEKLGNACVWVLANMPEGKGVPYLARVLARTKYPKIRKRLNAQLNEAAASVGISRADLDEATVPTHELGKDGKRIVEFSNGSATLLVEGAQARIEWRNARGALVKSPTKGIKEEADLLKDVRADLKELQADLSIQPQRLQKLYVQDRSWSFDDWSERYLEHPLLGSMARRLIWLVERSGGETVAIMPTETGQTLLSLDGRPVDPDGSTVRLWHPMDSDVETVEAWRDRLEELEITQPFAQAWREVYALTDAERQTATYSNRWAAHILKQQQAMTLARLNGWTVTARMWVDQPNNEPWHLHLPEHNLVAEYWIEGAGGDDPETTDSLAYLFVNTDRVTFFRAPEGADDSAQGPATGDPLPLDQIPPVVFSEVMRACDLVTAVTSIAADDAWLDRGQRAEHPSQWSTRADDYWRRTNTAELVVSGQRRRAMLERIIPRLAIADRLTLTDKALMVRGTRHTYEIHIGSGACSRAGRHICIVPKNSAVRGKIWLPFEGDRTLSIIISKAVLLAADDKITDPIILAQL